MTKRDPCLTGHGKSKKRYSDLEHARFDADRLSERVDEVYGVYTCPNCGFFHVGRNGKRIDSVANRNLRDLLEFEIGMRALAHLRIESLAAIRDRFAVADRKRMTEADC